MSELLEVAAHGVTAILATWLALLVLTRARRTPGAPIFSGPDTSPRILAASFRA